jgi:hypothetical protein
LIKNIVEISTKFIAANITSVGKKAIRIVAVSEIDSSPVNKAANLYVNRIDPMEKKNGKTSVANSLTPKIEKEKAVKNK